VLKDELREYGLPAENIASICEHYDSVESILDSEDYELAAIGELELEDVKKLKKFLAGKKKGVARDFLKRWGKVVSEENIVEAYKEYDKLSKLYPDSPVVWQIKGELLEKMGKKNEANEAYKKAKQLYDKKGEIVPSLLEEKIHGFSYKNTSKGNGFGLVNGFSFQNGRGSNVNGLSNGFRNGFKNGIINGSGLVNGTGHSSLRKRIKKAPPIMRFITSVIIIAVILYGPLLSMVFFEQEQPGFSVDGNFSEWNSVTPYYSLRAAPQDVNITMVKFHSESKGLYFFVESKAPLFENASGIYIYIDSDMNSQTGYSVDGIGADFMVELYGWNKSIVGKTLYFFNSTNQTDFSQFVSLDSVVAIVSGNKMEGFIPHAFPEFRSVVVSTDFAGGFDDVKVPRYGAATAYIQEKDFARVIPFNKISAIMRLEVFGNRYANINSLSLRFNGTAPPTYFDKIALYRDNGDGEFNVTSDKLISDSWELTSSGDVVFSNLNLEVGNATLFVAVLCHNFSLSEKSVVVSVSNISINKLYVLYDMSDGGSYIHRIPNEVHIDGSFLDWRHVKRDRAGDVVNPAGERKIGDYNIDLLKYASFAGHSLYFYVSVSGELMGGTVTPVVHFPTLPDSDRDTVPDKFDPYPHDFNNDGIPDNESYVVVDGKKLPDVDGDGIADYPYGPDMWLNTTIPSWFPKPYAGRHVSVYIGPVPHHPIYGYDTLRIYINSDNNLSTGYSLPEYPLGADYMVEMYGINGKVKNASLYRYTNHMWSYVRPIDFYKGYHSLELDSGLKVSKYTAIVMLSDWDSDRDISDVPMRSILTRSDYVHKQLHLHYNATTSTPYLNTTCGDTEYYGRIYAGGYANWIQFPSFAENFSIVAYPRIQLYLKPYIYRFWWLRYIPGMNVSLWIVNSTTGNRELGYDFNPDIENEGWYNFTISNTTVVRKGESLALNLSVTGLQNENYIDIYFNSSQYDSLIDLPTSTYVHINWVKTYNSSAETDMFSPGDDVYVQAKVSDPFGSYDIKYTNITIYSPDGNKVVDNATMTIIETGASYNIYEYSITAPSVGGVYEAFVTGVESNGVLDTNVTYFTITTTHGVALYPDQIKNGEPGTNVTFNLILRNIGKVEDTYMITSSVPTAHFPMALYINGSLAAKDSDGDGRWNWINRSWDPDNDGVIELTLSSLQSVNLTIVKNVPVGSWGTTDLTLINASSESNESIYDYSRIRVNVPYLSLSKVLYLNGTDQLAVKHGNSEQSVTINYNSNYTWSLPQVYYDINLTSYITINLYMDAEPSSWSAIAVKAELYADSTLIGEDEITGNGERWYTFTIEPQISTIPAGSSVSLVVSVSGYLTSATVYYDSSAHPSNVTIPTTSYIKIRYLKLYNSSGYETNNFSAGEQVIIKTRITSPFGTADIGRAYLNITNSKDNSVVYAKSMSAVSSGGGYVIYQYIYTLPEDALSGYWNVRVDVHDDPLIRTNATTQFFIPWNVSVSPNHNITTNVSSQDRVLYFNHTITNTGLGANIFEIKASSSNGFDIKLYINGNLAAEDYNGDGVWDYVNSNYDSDGDGNPDTGLLLPGESENVTLKVTIPAGFNGTENVSITAYSFLSQAVRSTAYDKINTVPELHDIIIIVALPLAIFLIKRKGRFTLS